jgi:hypothetical protein
LGLEGWPVKQTRTSFQIQRGNVVKVNVQVFPGSHLSSGRKYFFFCLCHIWIQICRVLALKHCLLRYMWPIMLNPTRHVDKNP